jgi:hypothetical protein
MCRNLQEYKVSENGKTGKIEDETGILRGSSIWVAIFSGSSLIEVSSIEI